MEITTEFIDKVEEDIEDALRSIGEKYDINIERTGRITYTNQSFTMKLEATLKGGHSMEEDEYNYRQSIHSLPDLHSVVDIAGRRLKMLGFNRRAKKYPVVCEDINNGKKYKLTIDQAKNSKVIGTPAHQ
jgi:hypothetical protein